MSGKITSHRDIEVVDVEQVDGEEVVNGLEGVWSQGVHLREALVDKL